MLGGNKSENLSQSTAQSIDDGSQASNSDLDDDIPF